MDSRREAVFSFARGGVTERKNAYMSIETTSTAVVAEFDAALDAYDNAREQDRINTATNTSNGVVSFNDKFQDSRFEDIANAGIYDAKRRAMGHIEKALASCESRLTKPPSEEAARYAMSISGRDNMTTDEINAALARYTDHTTQKAILAAAKRSGLYVDDKTETEHDIEGLRYLAGQVERQFSPYSIGTMSAGGRWIAKQTFGA